MNVDVFAAAPDAVVIVDEAGLVTAANEQTGEMFGYQVLELVGQPVEVLIPERFRHSHIRYRNAFMAAPTRRPMGLQLELFGRRKDGEEFPVEISLNYERDTDGRLCVIAFVRDATLKRRLESELARARAEAEQLQLVSERERIARELHDTVIQRLFAVGLALEATSRRPAADMQARLQQAVDDIDDTIRAIRSSIFTLETRTESPRSLRSHVLDVVRECAPTLGFEPAVSFDGPIDTLTTAEITESLVAVLREALSNIARHAHATSATVAVNAHDEITLVVTDDGIGAPSFEREGGHGIHNLHERARLLGGDASIGPLEPHGTRVQWRVPLPE